MSRPDARAARTRCAWSRVITAAALLLAGCTQSIVADGRIRPEPFADIRARTERARGIDLHDEIDVRVVAHAELAEAVREAALAAWDEHEYRGYEDALVAIGLWPPDRRLFDDYVAALGSEAVGLYVPQSRILYIVGDAQATASIALASFLTRRDLIREAVLTHELVHAIQHQAYPALVEMVTRLKGQDDAAAAVQAAIEGDAVRYGFAAMETNAPPPAPVDFKAKVEEEMATGALRDEPALIREAVVFPYTYGYRLSTLEGTLLLEDPPASTEQVLHLAKRREPFLAVDLRPLHSGLPRQCRLVYANTLGELGISILLRDLSTVPGVPAWEGWDGDRYLTARCGEGREFVWLTAWDSAEDAAEFVAAYGGVAEAVANRAELASTPSTRRSGRFVIVWTSGLKPVADRIETVARRTRVGTVTELLEVFSLERGAL